MEGTDRVGSDSEHKTRRACDLRGVWKTIEILLLAWPYCSEFVSLIRFHINVRPAV